LEDRLDVLEDRLRRALDDTPEPAVVVHGDYYEGQMLLDTAGRITGILDIDDVGIGDMAMDAANVCAHLATLAESVSEAGDRLAAYRRSLRAMLTGAGGLDPRSLASREAIAVLQLATGPLRVLDADWERRTEARVAIAERITDHAGVT
jgi:aminoglycoside phosphotransferase (APT) family kinase protein